jgi:hypothetical protein
MIKILLLQYSTNLVDIFILLSYSYFFGKESYNEVKCIFCLHSFFFQLMNQNQENDGNLEPGFEVVAVNGPALEPDAEDAHNISADSINPEDLPPPVPAVAPVVNHPRACVCHGIDNETEASGPLILVGDPYVPLHVPRRHHFSQDINTNIDSIQRHNVVLRNQAAALQQVQQNDFDARAHLARQAPVQGDWDREERVFQRDAAHWRLQRAAVNGLEGELVAQKRLEDYKQTELNSRLTSRLVIGFININNLSYQRERRGCRYVDGRINRILERMENDMYDIWCRQVSLRYLRMRISHLEIRLENERVELETLRVRMTQSGGEPFYPQAPQGRDRRGQDLGRFGAPRPAPY